MYVQCLSITFVFTGTWLKSSLGLVQQEGNQLTWTYIAPQLGYWVAAMSPTIPGKMELNFIGMSNIE